uniref:(California timema) hypothetical protein n=1 Tax=Timema californicum TaxID=61474 RepID=A0A7R9J1S9_TIMCA|nr:unnamed protein product [Timema californicum]
MNGPLTTFQDDIIVIPPLPLEDDYDDSAREGWFNPFSAFDMTPWYRPISVGFEDFLSSVTRHFKDLTDLASKGNTTSETKVINGTIMTINETSYIDEATGTVFRIKSIDLHPSEMTPTEGESKPDVTTEAAVSSSEADRFEPGSTEEIDSNPPSVGDVDIDETAKESNEIPTGQIYPLVAGKDSVSPHPTETLIRREFYYPEYNLDNEVEVFEVDHQPYDLQNDVYVNNILEEKIRQSGGMHQLHPDVELFDRVLRLLFGLNLEVLEQRFLLRGYNMMNYSRMNLGVTRYILFILTLNSTKYGHVIREKEEREGGREGGIERVSKEVRYGSSARSSRH